MQGIHDFIPTRLKAAYLNLLLQVGFDTIDFGSFVSPKAIPQLSDTREVLDLLDLSTAKSKLLAIVANLRGAVTAMEFPQISYIGFPFSVSETFQQRNTNSSRAASLDTVTQLLELCDRHGKQAVVYLSMGFGNPYGDAYDTGIVLEWASALAARGARILALSDTTGMSTAESITGLFPALVRQLPGLETGLHLHSTPGTRLEKIAAAYQSGCRRFDSAVKGFGGCPMAADDLTGNLATEDLIAYLEQQGEMLQLDREKWQQALELAATIFNF